MTLCRLQYQQLATRVKIQFNDQRNRAQFNTLNYKSPAKLPHLAGIHPKKNVR